MSDPNLTIQRQIQELQASHERLRKADVPALYLPWSQRTLNPFPLASSGGNWGDMPQPWSVNVLAWVGAFDVITTNNGTNFWTVALIEGSTGNTLASFTTASATVNTPTRFPATTITQPASSNPFISIKLTATLSPGSIFLFPALALLRTGN